MAQYLRYSGEFLSSKNVVWKVGISQEADEAFPATGVLDFPADEPLVIEWKHTDKHEVLCGSTATLTVVSPGDRTYEDLYTISPGSIRLDVLRNGILYWSGTLDPEFYEEPYAYGKEYEVTLTFSDFGILERLKYNLSGMRTLKEVLLNALGRSRMNYTKVDEHLISTSLSKEGQPMGLADLMVRSDNFYDEDSEACNLKEVLEDILQPLSLRMVQRNGKIWVYDLNGLYAGAERKAAEWCGEDQTMGTDVVYNNAQITWSTYAQNGNLAVKDCWTKDVDARLTAMNMLDGRTKDGSTYYSYHYSTNLRDWIDTTDSGFTFWVNKEGSGASGLMDGVKFFKMVPQNDGTEGEGIALYYTTYCGIKEGGSSNWSASLKRSTFGITPNVMKGTLAATGPALFRTDGVWLPPIDNADSFRVKICMEMLMDPRFNPYEQATKLIDGVNQKDWENSWNSRGNFVYVPVTVKYQPDDSDKVYCWTNRDVVSIKVDNPVTTLGATLGHWVECTGMDEDSPKTWGYLCYYNAEDHAEQSGVVGWKKNCPAINPHTKDLVTALAKTNDGQLVPYPKVGSGGGTLWVEVRSKGWIISDGGRNLSATEVIDTLGLWGKYSWLLVKLPEVEILNSAQFSTKIDTDDVEYSAYINASAKEDIKIDVVCGTSTSGAETARGAYFASATGKLIRTLSRGGRTTQAEELLIGTLYSQYSERRTRLLGTTGILSDGICLYTEVCQSGKCFICLHDVQNVIADESDMEIVELRPDEYKSDKE